MTNSFYYTACTMDAKNTPLSSTKDIKYKTIDTGEDNNALRFHAPTDGTALFGPHSIMNDNVAINYRNIYNGFASYSNDGNHAFTEYDDYLRCTSLETTFRKMIKLRQNPTYKNIILMYSDDKFDPEGLARYKMQDFIYCKYYNQIPNNYMVTLRRYTSPCVDRMFGLDFTSSISNEMNGNEQKYFALATAVTYMGEKPGNKLSDILKFDYGMNWEDKEGSVESMKSADGGLAEQLQLDGVRRKNKVDTSMQSGTMSGQTMTRNMTDSFRQAFTFSAAVQAKGLSVGEAQAAAHAYEGDEFAARYGEEFYGDVNVVNKVKMRSRGLTFTNSFSLNFEYSLKSLKCVNPRIAMMDILGNFLILTGNYGNFWGGATIFYGQHNIAPQFGDPALLRKGKYGAYISSLWNDVKEGFDKLKQKSDGTEGNYLTVLKNLVGGGLEALLGNLLGGNIGVAGTALAPKALLSGEPSGYWHVTVGNPLDPIAMMGNMAVTKTSVQFSDALGYDDFPTEIKFTVDLEHARPRDNAFIESMFNAGKGRIYTFTDPSMEGMMHTVNTMKNFQDPNSVKQNQQEVNMKYSSAGTPQDSNNARMQIEKVKIMGGNLYN